MDVVLVDRLQFAFTILFHYLFPIGTMGLAPIIFWYAWRAARTGNERDFRAGAFLSKLFAINFAIGVVTGIPMEFQFGTNWATFSARTGSVIGESLAIEGLYAFAIESVFLGVLLAGRRHVSAGFYAVAALLVWLGSWLSGFLVVTANGWMQHPVGYAIHNGTFVITDLRAVLLNEYAWTQFGHIAMGTLLAGGGVVAGIGAFYLLAQRDLAYGREFVRTGTVIAFVASILVVMPTGDLNSKAVTAYQPVKLAAMEGDFRTVHGAPIAIIGIPDLANRSLIDPIYVPDVLSFLAYGNFRASVPGLGAYATALWPPVELTYYAYHIMVGLGTIFGAVTTIAVLLLWRKRLYDTPLALWALMLMVPFPYIAHEAGWVVAEVGRQPWIVYGLLRTQDVASPNVITGEVVFTLIGFAGMYALLGLLFVLLTLRVIATGPTGSARVALEN
jgi:cytochrome d ubiquinol oxidase subunit I